MKKCELTVSPFVGKCELSLVLLSELSLVLLPSFFPAIVALVEHRYIPDISCIKGGSPHAVGERCILRNLSFSQDVDNTIEVSHGVTCLMACCVGGSKCPFVLHLPYYTGKVVFTWGSLGIQMSTQHNLIPRPLHSFLSPAVR